VSKSYDWNCDFVISEIIRLWIWKDRKTIKFCWCLPILQLVLVEYVELAVARKKEMFITSIDLSDSSLLSTRQLKRLISDNWRYAFHVYWRDIIRNVTCLITSLDNCAQRAMSDNYWMFKRKNAIAIISWSHIRRITDKTIRKALYNVFLFTVFPLNPSYSLKR